MTPTAHPVQPVRWGAPPGATDPVTLLLHPTRLAPELHPLLAHWPNHCGALWSAGVTARQQASLPEAVRRHLVRHGLPRTRLVLLDLSAGVQQDLARLFPFLVQEFLALPFPGSTHARAALLRDLQTTPGSSAPLPSGAPRLSARHGAA